MVDQADLARIRTYLKEHRANYARDVLRARLVADGHPIETIDLAFAQEYGLEVATTPRAGVVSPTPLVPGASKMRVFLIAFGVCLFNYIALPLLVGLFSETIDLGSGDDFVVIGVGLLVITFLLEGITAAMVRQSDRGLSRGLTWGLGVSLVPLIGVVVLLGIALTL